MFTIPTDVMSHPTLTATAKLVYAVLEKGTREAEAGIYRISHENIGVLVGANRVTARTATIELAKAGFIEDGKDDRGRLSYTLKA